MSFEIRYFVNEHIRLIPVVSINMYNIEKKHGTSLYVISNGSLDVFSDNNSSAFTNILHNKIILDPLKSYGICLGNIHIPSTVNILGKNDFKNSYVSYNIGSFRWSNSRRTYILKKDTEVELFKISPNKSFSGLDINEIPSSYTAYDNIEVDITGKPAIRIIKEKFISDIGLSYKLNENDNPNFIREQKLLNSIKINIAKSPNFHEWGLTSNQNLLIRYFADLNFLIFSNLAHLDKMESVVFLTSLMKLSEKYSMEKYVSIMEKVLLDPPKELLEQIFNNPKNTHSELKDLLTNTDQNLETVNFFNDFSNKEIREIQVTGKLSKKTCDRFAYDTLNDSSLKIHSNMENEDVENEIEEHPKLFYNNSSDNVVSSGNENNIIKDIKKIPLIIKHETIMDSNLIKKKKKKTFISLPILKYLHYI